MNISDVNATTRRSDHIRNSGVQGPAAIAPARELSRERPEIGADRVEISDEARAAARQSEELSTARNALHGIPELSESRTAQIIERIKSGYYSNPDVLQKIAERLGDELSGGSL